MRIRLRISAVIRRMQMQMQNRDWAVGEHRRRAQLCTDVITAAIQCATHRQAGRQAVREGPAFKQRRLPVT